MISALNMALITRKPGKVIHHSDQGSQYTSVELAIPRGLATGNIIVCVFEVSVARHFWFSAP
ncbi:hypothetical protein C8R28_105814 [Nitrosomonas ureae]|uniref:Uncharacterized protein n=1 Tax=Nitrosomonas ureae TaxID=44577 RepID=A0A2T5I5E4_9PROT|nr:hypothetical protein C8R28_105814 [Nitrosomonas ureae]